MSQQQKVISPLSYDTHFMPVTSDVDVSEKKLTMSKSDFNKFMSFEKKKERFNGRLFEYSKEHEKSRIAAKDLNNKIVKHDSEINYIKELQIQGNLETVEKILKNRKERIQYFSHLKNEAQREYNKFYEDYEQKFRTFGRKSCLAHIEDKLYLRDINTEVREKEERLCEKQRTFLKLLNKLPDEILRIVQSYFTYETRAAILLKTYNPIRMFCALDKSGLNKTISHINHKYAPVNKLYSRAWKADPELHNKMTKIYGVFYDRFRGKYLLSTSDLKIYLKHIFSLFHEYKQHQWCFDLYRAIIVCKK